MQNLQKSHFFIFKEIQWLMYIAVTFLFLLTLLTYSKNDSTYFYILEQYSCVKNWLGPVGANIANFTLWFFGISAYLLILPIIRKIFLLYNQLYNFCEIQQISNEHKKKYFIKVLSFPMLLISSTGFEKITMWSSKFSLPYKPGGILGNIVSYLVLLLFGPKGGNFILLFIIIISLSLFLNFSWLSICKYLSSTTFNIIICSYFCLKKICSFFFNFLRIFFFFRKKKNEFICNVLQKSNPYKLIYINKLFTHKCKISYLYNIKNILFGIIKHILGNFKYQNINIKNNTSNNSLERIALLEKKKFFSKRLIKSSINELTNSNSIEQNKSQLVKLSCYSNDLLLPLSLLDPASSRKTKILQNKIKLIRSLIEKKLQDFGVKSTVVGVFVGPVITRYEIAPSTGIRGSRIVNLEKDLARSLSLVSIRIIETIPGKNLMGLEIPNDQREIIHLSEIINTSIYKNSCSPLTVSLGKNVDGEPICVDLIKMPHLLIAGTTGSGKSVGINAMILSLLYKSSAKYIRMVMIDPKMIELTSYEGIPHLLYPVITDMNKVIEVLNWIIIEMEQRYKLMSKLNVRNIINYNKKIINLHNKNVSCLPFIVVIIDELADLMLIVGKKVEELIVRIAQKSRAAGIHLILATQRPSVNVITGLIKANMPARIAFQVSSKIDSRTILDQSGAELLLGKGDMLYLSCNNNNLPIRVHGAFISDDEIIRVVEYIKKKTNKINYVESLSKTNVKK